jgi:hypothetical protein
MNSRDPIGRRSAAAAAVVALALSAAPAAAQEEDSPLFREPGGSYFSLALSGGIISPLGTMSDGHRSGLAAAAHIGWTADSGLGVAVNSEYSPLPPAANPGVIVKESHLGAASLTPRFTLGHHTLRMWVAAGGGVVMERTRTEFVDSSSEVEFDYEAAAVGGAGLELHMFDSGGLSLVGNYTRSLQDTRYQFLSVTGGLVLTFR